MEAYNYVSKQKYFASMILHLLIGVFIGYIAGYKAALQPTPNPDHFQSHAIQSMGTSALETGEAFYPSLWLKELEKRALAEEVANESNR